MRLLRVVALAVALVAPAHADRLGVEDYGPADKLGRGLANMVTGVLALPGSVAEGAHENGASGAAVGLGKGIARTIARELVGVYEFVTFPLPAPRGYRPILDPPYPWEYFQDRHTGLRPESGLRDIGDDTTAASAFAT